MKMMIVGRRRGGMTLRELHAYMADVHGPMVVRYIEAQPELAPRRYAQNHVFDGACRVPRGTGGAGDAPDPFALNRDFVTQVWFDNPAQAGASLATPFYREQLLPDEDRFVDQASVVKIPVIEHELRSGAGAPADGCVKLFLFLKRVASVTHDDFIAASDGVADSLRADDTLGAGRWVRNEALQRPDQNAPVDVIHELWFADEPAARLAGAKWLAAVQTTLAASIEPGSTCLLLAHEHVMFAGHTA